jgi:hypothetical protein
VSLLPVILMASSAIPVLSPGRAMPALKGEYLAGRQRHAPNRALRWPLHEGRVGCGERRGLDGGGA